MAAIVSRLLRQSGYANATYHDHFGEKFRINEIAKSIGVKGYVSPYNMGDGGWLGCEKGILTPSFFVNGSPYGEIFVNGSPYGESNGYSIAKALISIRHRQRRMRLSSLDRELAFEHSTPEDLADAIYEREVIYRSHPNCNVEEIRALEHELSLRKEVRPLRVFYSEEASEDVNREVRRVIHDHPLSRLLVNVNQITIRGYKGGLSVVFHRRGRRNSIGFPLNHAKTISFDSKCVAKALESDPVFNMAYTLDTVGERNLITRQEESAHKHHGCRFALVGNFLNINENS